MRSFQYEPCGDGAIRHFGVPSAFITGRPGFTMSAVKAVYQKICWAILPCDGTGPDSEKVMPCACGGGHFFIPYRYIYTRHTPPRPVTAPPASHPSPGPTPASLHMSAC